MPSRPSLMLRPPASTRVGLASGVYEDPDVVLLSVFSEQANVVVHQFKAPRFFIPLEKARLTIHLSYHGEHHYNSVRAIGDEGAGPARPITLQTPTSRNAPRLGGEICCCSLWLLLQK